MGSPLGPVLANIFMVELQKSVISHLSETLDLRFRCEDGTFTFIKAEEIEFVTHAINSFHDNIKFTSVKEKDNKLAFLYSSRKKG